MSKSLGNFFTIREVLARYDAETVRFFLLRAHYRSELNYSDHSLDDARAALRRLYTALQLVPPLPTTLDWSAPLAARFKAAMDEDFGTPEAMAVLFELATEVNKTRSAALSGLLRSLGGTLGILQGDPSVFLRGQRSGDGQPVDATIDALVAARAAAKAARDFAEADRIRKQLSEAGIVVKDSTAGTTWERSL